MRLLGALFVTAFGVGSLVVGTVSTVVGSDGWCPAIALVTGGGSGGGIICSDANCTSSCHFGTFTGGGTVATYCYCGSNNPPLCCFIASIQGSGPKPFSAGVFGDCNVDDPPCPIIGDCQELTNGSQHTAECGP